MAPGRVCFWRVRQPVRLKYKKRLQGNAETRMVTGARSRNRTNDLLITNQLLYQLSYAGLWCGWAIVKNGASCGNVRSKDIRLTSCGCLPSF